MHTNAISWHVRKVICPWTSPLNVGWCWMCWTISKRLYKLTQTITYQYIETYQIYKWSHTGSCIPMTWAKGPCMSMHTGKHARIPHANIHTETYHTCTQFQRSPCLPRCQVEWYEKWNIVMEIACIKIIKRHWHRIHTLRYKLHSIVLLCVALHYISNHFYIQKCAQTVTNACSHGATRISCRCSSLWPRSWNCHATWNWWPWGRGRADVLWGFAGSPSTALRLVCYNFL